MSEKERKHEPRISIIVNEDYRIRAKQAIFNRGMDNLQLGYLAIFNRGLMEFEKELKTKKGE